MRQLKIGWAGTKLISVRVRNEVHDVLMEDAQREERSLASYVRRVFEREAKAIEERERWKKVQAQATLES